ncbi:hypothetical protein GQ55_3G296600 [Panicum hallii var. hallii]|jgi:hypothetical protein|uniref:Uncharacterized protein n=1 Tax=Panicum hallii var. hallii TaxID=1504633 RepID=A0A2T7EEN9_9POAL|nr:hypothetical protein GQ55_3G296600 [Panicum hallii var. hallii]
MVVCTESTSGSACLLAVTPSGFDRAGLDSTYIFISLVRLTCFIAVSNCVSRKQTMLPLRSSVRFKKRLESDNCLLLDLDSKI